MAEYLFDHDRLDVDRLSIELETSFELRFRRVRIVAMLTRMAMKFDGVSDSLVEYTLGSNYEHEHRDAEHEHEEMPEQSMNA